MLKERRTNIGMNFSLFNLRLFKYFMAKNLCYVVEKVRKSPSVDSLTKSDFPGVK